MTSISVNSYRFAVDIASTRAYYQKHSLCSCAPCRNFYAQIQSAYPHLHAFLQHFGVETARPDEISSIESIESIDYIEVSYSVCGHIEAMDEYEIDLNPTEPVSIVVHKHCAAPNEQESEYFTLCVYGIHLPWGLDEPFPVLSQKRRRLYDFCSRLFPHT